MVCKLPLCSISVHIDKDILFFFFYFIVVDVTIAFLLIQLLYWHIHYYQ